MPSKLPQIGVRVAPALFERLREVAAKDGRSLSNFVAQHLQAHFGWRLPAWLNPRMTRS